MALSRDEVMQLGEVAGGFAWRAFATPVSVDAVSEGVEGSWR